MAEKKPTRKQTRLLIYGGIHGVMEALDKAGRAKGNVKTIFFKEHIEDMKNDLSAVNTLLNDLWK